MPLSEMNPLYQQIGEILSGLKALHDKVDIRHAQAEKLGDTLQAELRTVKHDQRDLEQKLDGAVYFVKQDVDSLKAATVATSRSLEELTAAVETLKHPVDEIMALRSRAMGVLLALSTLGSVFLYFFGPVYHWAVDHFSLPR